MKLECGCGAIYDAKRRSKFRRCPACALRAKQIKQGEWRARCGENVSPVEMAFERHVITLIVVSDPLKVGAFSRGTSFDMQEWQNMVRRFSFTKGTILRDSIGRIYEVRYGTCLE